MDGKQQAEPLQKDFDAVDRQLTTAVHLFATVWKLKLPPKPTAAGDSDALQSLELANDPGKLTVVGVIGWIYLDESARRSASWCCYSPRLSTDINEPIQMYLLGTQAAATTTSVS